MSFDWNRNGPCIIWLRKFLLHFMQGFLEKQILFDFSFDQLMCVKYHRDPDPFFSISKIRIRNTVAPPTYVKVRSNKQLWTFWPWKNRLNSVSDLQNAMLYIFGLRLASIIFPQRPNLKKMLKNTPISYCPWQLRYIWTKGHVYCMYNKFMYIKHDLITSIWGSFNKPWHRCR